MTSISVRTGAEGPRHDPYHYEEITVCKPNNVKVTLHRGLATWIEVAECDVIQREDDERRVSALFEKYVGVTIEAAQRAYLSLPLRRLKAHPCGVAGIVDVNGYPGETLTVCVKCGHVVDSHQDMASIT